MLYRFILPNRRNSLLLGYQISQYIAICSIPKDNDRDYQKRQEKNPGLPLSCATYPFFCLFLCKITTMLQHITKAVKFVRYLTALERVWKFIPGTFRSLQSELPTLRYIFPKFSQCSPLHLVNLSQISHKVWSTSCKKQFSNTP